MAYSLPTAMALDQAVLHQADFEKLLKCFNVNVVVEHLSRKGFLYDQEVRRIKYLNKRQDIVSFLYCTCVMKANASRFSEFLDELDIFAREHFSNILNQIIELKKTRMKSRAHMHTRIETVEKKPHFGSNSKPIPLNLDPEEMKQVTLSKPNESCGNTSEHVSL